MTGEHLIEVGRGLARPCLYLADEGEGREAVAVWGGRGLVPAPPGPYRHWLTLSGPALAEAGIGGLTGRLSVYTDEEGGRDGAVVADGSESLVASVGGVPLFGRKSLSLPPVEAVFLYGPPSVRA